MTYVSILSPIILSSHWLFSKHSLSCLPRNSTLVGQQLSPQVRNWGTYFSLTRMSLVRGAIALGTVGREFSLVTFGLVFIVPTTTTTKHWPTQPPIPIKSPDSLLAGALLHQILKLFKFQIAQKFVCKLPTFGVILGGPLTVRLDTNYYVTRK